ncbi:MAG: hypothetical protein V1887_01575 [Candidatus Aenigmatarchaeota archaeon]
MNKMMTLAVFGVAALAVTMAMAVAAPPAKAWDTNDMCFVYASTTTDASKELPTEWDIVYAIDAADLGCIEAVTECENLDIPGLVVDESWGEYCE